MQFLELDRYENGLGLKRVWRYAKIYTEKCHIQRANLDTEDTIVEVKTKKPQRITNCTESTQKSIRFSAMDGQLTSLPLLFSAMVIANGSISAESNDYAFSTLCLPQNWRWRYDRISCNTQFQLDETTIIMYPIPLKANFNILNVIHSILVSVFWAIANISNLQNHSFLCSKNHSGAENRIGALPMPKCHPN